MALILSSVFGLRPAAIFLSCGGVALAVLGLIRAHRKQDLGWLPNAGLASNLLFLLVSGGMALAAKTAEQTTAATKAEPMAQAEASNTALVKARVPDIADLVAALDDPSNEVRLKAIQTLGRMGASARLAYYPLHLVRNNGNKIDVDAALRNLGCPGPLDVPDFRAALKTHSVPLRVAAAQAFWQLGPCGKEAIADLKECLGHADAWVSLWSAQALVSLGHPPAEVLPPLLRALRDKRAKVRSGAARLVGEIGAEAREAVSLLTELLMRDEAAGPRFYAAQALGRIGPAAKNSVATLVVALHDSDSNVRGAAAGALGQLGPDARPAVPELVRSLRDSSPAGVRRALLAALAAIGPAGPDALPALLDILHTHDAQQRLLAVKALGRMGAASAPAVEQLADLLDNDRDADVRAWTAHALATLGPKAAAGLGPLMRALRQDKSEHVRRFAALALGRVGNSGAAMALAAATADPDPLVRAAARKALTVVAADGQ